MLTTTAVLAYIRIVIHDVLAYIINSIGICACPLVGGGCGSQHKVGNNNKASPVIQCCTCEVKKARLARTFTVAILCNHTYYIIIYSHTLYLLVGQWHSE